MTRPSPARRGRVRRRTVLRLYVAGSCRNSSTARKNLEAVTAGAPEGALDLEVVDVFKCPQRALADGVIVTPTLIRLFPRPVEMIIGDLSDWDGLRAILGPISTPAKGPA